jgi:hypothetical protein
VGHQIEADSAHCAKDLSEEERLIAFNVHMEKYGQLSQNGREDGTAHETNGGVSNGHWLVANYEAGDVVFHDPVVSYTRARRTRATTDGFASAQTSDFARRGVTWMIGGWNVGHSGTGCKAGEVRHQCGLSSLS